MLKRIILLIVITCFVCLAANEIQIRSDTGEDRYIIITRKSDMYLWDDTNSVFSQNPPWDDRAVALTENPYVDGLYYATFPDANAGEYNIALYNGAAASASSSDVWLSDEDFFWDGSEEITFYTMWVNGGGGSLIEAAGYLGDYKIDETVNFIWRTYAKDGSSVNPTGGTIKVYKNNSTIEITTPIGIKDTRGFGSLTGVHLCSIDLSSTNFYERIRDYCVVLAGTTIDGESVTTVLATFSIQK